MYLKRLEIHGFKSFAQKTTLEFGQGIIGIVGPNGSGKSNVADSIRWVLGEQSPKLIRGKKSEDVIFAGSDKKVRLGAAEVTATFDNGDRRIPVDASEVSIGRRIDRSGESEYLINGNKVRLLDIVDLVLRSNIGTSRYTVIGQGTIDQMILAGPSEVKGLLDEASGVKSYQIKREKTLRRLEQTAQNLMRAEDLLGEIEPRLKSLRRQAKKMEARAEFETELKIYQREFLGSQFWQFKIVLEKWNGQLTEKQTLRQELEQKIFEYRQQLDAEEKNTHVGNHQFKVLQEELTKLQNLKNKFLEDLSLIRGKMQSQKTVGSMDSKTLAVEVHTKQQQIVELEKKIAQTKEQQGQFQTEIVGQEETLRIVGAKLEQFYEQSKNPLQIDWTVFDREILSLEKVMENFDLKIQSAQSLEQIKVEVQGLKVNFDKFKQATQTLVHNPRATMDNFRLELDSLLSQRENLSKAVAAHELELSKLAMSVDFMEKQLGALNQEKLHLELELKKASSGSEDEFLAVLVGEENKIKSEIEKLVAQMTGLEQEVGAFYKEQEQKQQQFRIVENKFRDEQDSLNKIKDEESYIKIEKARIETQMKTVEDEILKVLGQGELNAINVKPVEKATVNLEEKISRLQNQLEMIGGMDELTLKEYEETETRFTNLNTQVQDLKKGMADLKAIIDELDEHIKTRFNEAFHKVNEKFENYFRVLFNGGRAYLSLLKEEEKSAEEMVEEETDMAEEITDQLRPEEKVLQKYSKPSSVVLGVDIKATPPGKKLASIQALSGGERALTSIALLCSLLNCFPSPFVVLDEVDAALDDANTIRFGQILGTLANQTQFVTITHNRETMAGANMLYGVTMGDDGISKLLSIKLDQAKSYAK